MVNNNEQQRKPLDHTRGLNFKRIAMSDEMYIIRPSVEQAAELRHQRLQDRQAERDYLLKEVSAFKDTGLWSRCKETLPVATSAVEFDCQCVQQVMLSKEVLEIDASRLSNILASPKRKHSFFCRCCRRKMYRYNAPSPEEIFQHPTLSGAIRVSAHEYLADHMADTEVFSETYGRAAKKVAALLYDMRAKMNSYVIQFTGWLFSILLPKMFDRLVVSDREMAMLKHIQGDNIPLIYLPLHRSHLDYILLPYVLWYHNLPLPFVAAGDNLKLPFVSTLLRRFGGFFIRRKINGDSEDNIYRALLQTYVERLLIHGQSLEFYLEAGRSRTGRTRSPKTGILSMINNACFRGPVRDVYLVPMAIGYENPPDTDFSAERMGQPKPKETLWSLLRAVWSFWRTPRGFVRFSFCRPVRLHQFRDSMEIWRREGDTASVGSDEKTTEKLAQHALFMATRRQPLMSTHLFAFLLLTQFRRGAELAQLGTAFNALTNLLRSDAVIGFHDACSGTDAVIWAAELLAPLVIMERSRDGRLERVAPRLTAAEALHLAHFAGPVLALLALDAVRACAFVRLRGAAASPEVGLLGRLNDSVPTPGVDGVQFREAAMKLTRILAAEFIFCPPCDRMDVMINRDSRIWRMLKRVTDPGCLDRRRREVMPLPPVPEAEEQVTIDLGDPEKPEMLQWLCMAIGPVLEAYWITCFTIYNMRLTEVSTEAECVRQTMMAMRARKQSELLLYVECQCTETVRTCMRMLEDWNIIDRNRVSASTVSISLQDSDSLLELMQFIESCLVRP